MQTLAKDFTDEQRDIFATYFCETYYDEDAKVGVPCPYCCPWDFGSNVYLEGETIEEMADKYWLDVKEEIANFTRDDEERDEELEE